jgi:hypothetical protein
VTVGSARGTSVRDEVTFTASKNAAGCRVTSIAARSPDTGSMACAKPAAVTTRRRPAAAPAGRSKVKRPSAAVRNSASAVPAASSLTDASGTGAPVESTTDPDIDVCAAAAVAMRSTASKALGVCTCGCYRRGGYNHRPHIERGV